MNALNFFTIRNRKQSKIKTKKETAPDIMEPKATSPLPEQAPVIVTNKDDDGCLGASTQGIDFHDDDDNSSVGCPTVAVQQKIITLPNGASLQVLFSIPFTPKQDSEKQREVPNIPLESSTNDQSTSSPSLSYSSFPPRQPILFVHGSFHGAWCWQEHFFPYFVSRGYPVVAISLRGTHASYAGDGIKHVTIENHVHDLSVILYDILPIILGDYYEGFCDDGDDEQSRSEDNYKPPKIRPILVTHSLGGLLTMKFLEKHCTKTTTSTTETVQKPSQIFSAIVSLCPLPPSGYSRLTKRLLWKSPYKAWKIIQGIPMKRIMTDLNLCRQIFFTPTADTSSYGVLSDAEVRRYQSYFARDGRVSIDASDLAKDLPIQNKKCDTEVASYANQLPPTLVIGAAHDFMIDREGILETATYFGIPTVATTLSSLSSRCIIIDAPHDIMLAPQWKECARTIYNWIDGMTKQS